MSINRNYIPLNISLLLNRQRDIIAKQNDLKPFYMDSRCQFFSEKDIFIPFLYVTSAMPTLICKPFDLQVFLCFISY